MVAAARLTAPAVPALRSAVLALSLLAAAGLLCGCRKMGGLEGQPLGAAAGAGGSRPQSGAGGAGDNPEGGGVSETGAPDADAPLPPPFSREALLGAFADCAVTGTAEFERRALSLRDAARTHASTPSDVAATRTAAAWREAIDHWQVLEVFQYGPAAMSSQPGGRELRDQIYIWPLFNRCLTEQLMVSRAAGDDTFEAQFERFANVRGLGALDYVLFYGGSDNACPPANPINGRGTWAALEASGLPAARADYALFVAEDVARRAAELSSAWAPAGGNFRDSLAHAGEGGSVYTTVQAGLNAVSDALFYLDTEAKDMKLAAPMGLAESCTSASCPWLVESPFAGRSLVHIRNNLVGFQRLFSGCSSERDLGFDDLLVDVGQSGLSERMAAALGAARAAVDAIEEPSLEAALIGDVGSVWALYDAVKSLTDLLKTEFVSVLNFGRPPGAGTDND